MEEYDTAVEHFERAMDHAKQLNDEDTQAAILKAMKDVNCKLSRPDMPSTKGKEQLDLGEGSGTAEEEGYGWLSCWTGQCQRQRHQAATPS